MDVELLVVPEWPNIKGALALVRAALDALDLVAQVTVIVIQTEEQAQTYTFAGSPTFLVNGRDPFAEPGASVCVACRLYPTSEGLAGLPSAEGLLKALKMAAA